MLRRSGYDLVRFDQDHPLWRRLRLMESAAIDLVLDVGGGRGEYGVTLRQFGYGGRIVSFEPLSDAFRDLSRAAEIDPLWRAENFALGDADETRAINVASNSASSSFLAMLPQHVESAPQSAYVGTERVRVRTLNEVFAEHAGAGDRVFLKIDTQGYEERVLRGGVEALDDIALVQMEACLCPLYEGNLMVADAISLMAGMSFTLVSIEPGFADPRTGRQLQADLVFAKADPVTPAGEASNR